jgi:hypothetical protein
MLAGLAFADQTDFGSASVAAPWLKLPPSARAAAMAEAGTALAGELDSLALNPAGLAEIKGMQASLMHNSWIQGAAIERLGAGMALGDNLGLALGFDSLAFGGIEGVSIVNNQAVLGGSVSASAMQGSLGAGYRLGNGFCAGLAVKFAGQNLDGASSSALAADLGGNWRSDAFSAGLSVLNLGSQMEGYDLPRMIRAGAGYTLEQAVLCLDVALPMGDTNALALSLGGEYTLMRMLAVRAGYKFQDRGNIGGLTGLCAGLGFTWKMIEVSYAFNAMGDLGNGNLVSLTGRF